MPMALREIVSALVLLAISGFYIWATFHIPDRTIPNTPGPSFFPFVIAGIVACLSSALLTRGILRLRGGSGVRIERGNIRSAIATLALFAVFLTVLPHTGFVIAGVGFFAGSMFLYGARSLVRIVLWSLAVPVVLFLVFTRIFHILLPSGPSGI